MSETSVGAKRHPLSEEERFELRVELELHSRAAHAWHNAQARLSRRTTAIQAAAHKRLEIAADATSKFLLDKSTGSPLALEVTEAAVAAQNLGGRFPGTSEAPAAAPAQVAPENVAAPV